MTIWKLFPAGALNPPRQEINSLRLFLLTLAAMIAFAGNSLLCRAALKQTSIDAASFSSIRLLSGAAALWLIASLRSARWRQAGNWPSALALFAYAAAFSFAYVSLSAATGTLLLFGAVQATMILWGLRKREALRATQLFGLALAFAGFLLLVFPGLSSPPLHASILMLAAGVAWGIYSLRGKGATDPVATTTGNFLRAIPFAALLGLAFIPRAHLDSLGLGYAVLSGALASGLGYVIWYSALPGLTAAGAATVQLSVPVLAASGGILLLGEPVTLRLFLASIAILGGIALVVISRRAPHKLRTYS